MKRKTVKKVDQVTSEIEQAVTSKKAITLALFIALMLATYASNSLFYLMSNYKYQPFIVIKIQWPIVKLAKEDKKIISPISVSAQEISPSPSPTPRPVGEEAITKRQKHGETLWKIYQLETERGKTDYCRLNNQGFGGFGVKYYDAENNHLIACYETFEKAAERASYWWDLNVKDRTLKSALCKWSGHGDVKTCEYAENFDYVDYKFKK